MKALIIQHEKDITVGTALDWLQARGIHYQIHFFSDGDCTPSIASDDLVFIAGAKMNVDQENEFPWLTTEKKFIKNLIERNIKIIGICFGAQLLADVLGGKVFKAEKKEMGWYPVKLLEPNQELMFFHWHGYQFETPLGAVKISESAVCPHQGFRYQKNILAFQFHPEATRDWVMECACDPELPAPMDSIQTSLEIKERINYQQGMQDWFFLELDSFLVF